jgi:trehalose 6-phosphate phosphatase
MICTPQRTKELLGRAGRVWLFLDYDGTLAELAPTPDHIEPIPELLDLLPRLAAHPGLRVSIVSGRRLGHVQSLLPVSDILLAGTYGVEMQTHEGERIHRVEYEMIRPVLEALKPRWEQLLGGRAGFFLEDKGWSLAIHARHAEEQEGEEVVEAARDMAEEAAAGRPFRVLGGYKFVEIGPKLAHKGETVEHLLQKYPWPGALPVYLGDDDKDEEAFGVIKAHGGVAILVARKPRPTLADCRLQSPQDVRRWLERLPAYLEQSEPVAER